MIRTKKMIMLLKANAYKYAPTFAKVIVKNSLRQIRRLNSKCFQEKVTKQSLIRDFQNIGISQGDIIMFHSSLSRLGNVENGPETVINALLETVGKDGTLVAPTFSHISKRPGDFTKDPLRYFDARATPSGVGKITETFRHYKYALRSCHPTHSVAAIGRHADYIIKDHHQCQTPFGKGSPFYRIWELAGKWFFLCVDIDKFTMYHVFEDYCDNFPLKVYYDEPLIVKAFDMNGIERIVKTRLHDRNLHLTRIDNDKTKIVLNRIRRRFDQMGILKKGLTAHGVSYLIDAQEGMDALKKLLEIGETIYLSDKEKGLKLNKKD